jgi:hypothetical protein
MVRRSAAAAKLNLTETGDRIFMNEENIFRPANGGTVVAMKTRSLFSKTTSKIVCAI